MVKYIGPRLKIIRRLGILPGFSKKKNKNINKQKSLIESVQSYQNKQQHMSLADDYKQRLIEKQKVRYNYGITESQLITYYKKAQKQRKSTGDILLAFLESRLDCIVYRLGFAPTIPNARQIINHRHILVNGKMVNIPSFSCKKGDIISIKDRIKSKNLIYSNFYNIEEKRKNLIEKMKSLSQNYISSAFVPAHLELKFNLFSGKIIKPIQGINNLIKINNLKLIEYYSH